jgi:hypothetical protein
LYEYCPLSLADKKCSISLPPLAWSAAGAETQAVTNSIHKVVAHTAWDACCQIPFDDKSTALHILREFDFCHLTTSTHNERQLIPFLNWLSNNVSSTCTSQLLFILVCIGRRRSYYEAHSNFLFQYETVVEGWHYIICRDFPIEREDS